ncbi:MAG TPA: hypothetical protein VGO80_20645 [Solirubrobacteraceae bacterium]|jgi:hypothetical protein|nr:hypothetical protein [Solirubrobacteraceae bacterium]
MTRAARQQARRNAQRQRRVYQQQQLQQRSASSRKQRQRRNATAWGLRGATEFSADSVLSNPVAVVEMFKRWAPATALELIRATTPDRYPGQPGARRMGGSWALVFLAHIQCGCPDWQRWYHDWQDSRLWQVCGFDKTPSWTSLYGRFAELEHPRYVAAFERAANHFVRVAARAEPRALRHFHTDGTAAHSHARLEHACPNPSYCRSCTGTVAKRLARASDEDVSHERHVRSAAPEPVNPDAPPDPVDDQGQVDRSRKVIRLTDAQAQDLALPYWRDSLYVKFGSNGHIYRCRDKQAGVRAYTAGPRSKRKVWVGGYFLPAICDFFWAPAAVNFFEAGIQEHLGWPPLYRKLLTALNDDPDEPTHIPTAVVADKAFTNRTFIAFNTNEGVASITPTRRVPGNRHWSSIRDPDGRYDEHGPRCQRCGGPAAPYRGVGEGFALTGTGDPRISYRCAIGWTTECQNKLQSISCRREPRALLPIGRNEKLFHDLMASHNHFEGVFDSWRDRYAVSGNSNATRSKRTVSIPAQRLRAAAALLSEWFRIGLRMGYVGNHTRRNPYHPVERDNGGPGYAAQRRYRARNGLALPIGPAATSLGLAPVPAAAARAPNAPPPAAPP